LWINFKQQGNISHYKRQLDISKAVFTVSYVHNEVQYTRTSFASFTENAIVYHIKANKKKAVSFTIHAEGPHQHTIVKAGPEQHSIQLSAALAGAEGIGGAIKYVSIFKIINTGGKYSVQDNAITLTNADEATIYITIASNFKNYKEVNEDAKTKADAHLEAALKKPYATLLQNHIKTYQSSYNTVQLQLGSSEKDTLPTNERLHTFNQKYDPQFISLYFQFGRYLMLSSSRKGSQASNLQGKWNDKLKPAWDSKYTININTEMNYWPAEATNLSDNAFPLFALIKDLSVTGRQAAKDIYGTRGWVAHHNTDLWRITGIVDGGWYGMWPMGGAWLCRHLWEHYLYTGDTAFLNQHYELLRDAAMFYVDNLQKEPDHNWLVVSPSMSPENSYMSDEKGNKIALTYGTTMDNQILFELFHNYLQAASILNKDASFADTVRQKMDQLPPMQIGKYGQLQEWIEDWDRPNDHHRHISQLFGLYPSNQISAFKNKALFDAAYHTLISRGDVSTGWSMGWKVNFWARMLDGNHAFLLIKNQLSPIKESESKSKENGGGTYPNLFDAHPPFQIDGNFGCTAGITEMLLQSHDGSIFPLPALPDEWKSGSVKGLKTRGNFTVDIYWENNQLTKLKIHAALGGNCRLRLKKELIPKGNINIAIAKGPNPNTFFETPDIKAPVIHANTNETKAQVPVTTDWDFDTIPGKDYELIF
jgi:alpha-L-fucosidase 2